MEIKHVRLTNAHAEMNHTVVMQFAFELSHSCRSRVFGKKKNLSQANEGMWGMPGHTEAMKAVVSCDKLGGAAHTH